MKRPRQFLINYLTRNLLRAVTEEDILQITSEGYLYHKKKILPDELSALKDEAAALKESFIWRLMTKEVEYMAFMTMTAKARTNDDIIFGKAVFYSVSLFNKFLENLK